MTGSLFTVLAPLLAIAIAQLIKIPIAYFSNNQRASIKLAISTGGMPSSHSAAVSALITALVLEYGLRSPLVAIAITFGVIIMFDAMGVRRQSGEQGIVLEKIVKELKRQNILSISFEDPDDGEELSIEDLTINKYLGHKPTEVFAGMFTGVITTILCDFILYLFQ